MSNLSFAGVLKAPFNTSGCIVDFYNNSIQSARDDTCLKTAVWQLVSLSCRTLCPILLRQITHNYHRVEGCAPFQSQSVCVALLTHTMCVSFAVRSRREPSPHARTSKGAARSIINVSAQFKVQCPPSLRPPSDGVPFTSLRSRHPRRVAALRDWPECSRLPPLSLYGPRTWLSLPSSLLEAAGFDPLWARPSGINGTARIKASTRD